MGAFLYDPEGGLKHYTPYTGEHAVAGPADVDNGNGHSNGNGNGARRARQTAAGASTATLAAATSERPGMHTSLDNIRHRRMYKDRHATYEQGDCATRPERRHISPTHPNSGISASRW